MIKLIKLKTAELPGVKKACDYFLADKPEKVCEVFRGMAKIVKE